MTDAGVDHAKKIQELVERIHSVHQRLGVPDNISFLDGCLCISWGVKTPGMDRYEEVSVDAELLHYSSRTAGGRCEIHIHIHGYVPPKPGKGSKVRPGEHDVAEASKEPK